MTPNEDKALTIYKASAGSGKTFTLSIEYIKLLIKNPMSFHSTLAVTFTNKATEEMKTRILSQLYGIWKQLPDSKSYIEKIRDDLGVTETFMAERAKTALRNIVHNYSYFRIETIDSFFQSVLRNLARELDLTANLRIELNDRQIESIAVDELIDNLDEKDELLKWILGYIKENIDDDKNWNVIGHIKSFGENIFREFYKTNSKTLNKRLLEKGFFESYKRQLRELRDNAEKAMKDSAEEFFTALEDKNVSIDELSYGKSGPAGFFLKMRNGQYDESIVTARVRKAIDEESGDCWVKKSADDTLRDFAQTTLAPMLVDTEYTRQTNWKPYESAVLTLKHLNQLRLLNSIEQKVRELNNEANRFLLSDTHTLLHSLIKDSDSPFIFEKIGARLENVMIDEFQDTSTVQWQNFKVLLEECMSHSEEHGNLIVGDVKQSIYRWRSGDWRMLNNIKDEFPYMGDLLDIRTLKHNYRSTRRIVDFNNAFFTRAAEIEYDNIAQIGDNSELLASQLKRAYDDVAQKVPDGRADEGYVHIELLPQADYTEEALARTVENIDELIEHGAKPSDIAIIVRSNTTIRQIAEYFALVRPQLKVVSDEAFRLDNSICLNIIVAAMQCLVHRDDVLTKAFLAKAFLTKVCGLSAEEANSKIASTEDTINLLPHDYRDKQEELVAMPVYELTEKLYKVFGLEKIGNEDAYLFAFFDCLTTFLSNNAACIDDFITEWNDTFCSKTIQASTLDGIRLITIHKSKGLEFEHVIIPFCDWRLEKMNTIWCAPAEAPFNYLPLVPVDFNAKQMKGTVYEDDYIEEHLQNCVDNLNLLYVAFTRAERSLIVIAKRGNSSLRSNIIENVITDIQLEDCSITGNPKDNKSEISLTYGEIGIKKNKKEEKVSENIFMPEVKTIDMKMESFDNNTEFKQSNKSQEFINDEDDDEQLKQQLSYIKAGRMLHYLFSNIDTIDDVDRCLDEMEMNGLTDDGTLNKEELRGMLHKRFANSKVQDWFSGKWTLFNECTILAYDPNTGEVRQHRPDRVMKKDDTIVIVDFKFGNPSPKYADQIRRYIALICDMGYTDVKGYLWYVYSNTIEEVKILAQNEPKPILP